MKEKKQLWQAAKFLLFSVSAGVIQIGSFAILEIFIKDYWILQLDLDRKTVLRCADCENTGGLQEIYSADSCYIIKGECEIFRYDKALDQIWCRCGRDIFARPTEEKCFWIEENLIHCRDWEGWHYVLDMDGNKIDEFQETLSHHTGGVL